MDKRKLGRALLHGINNANKTDPNLPYGIKRDGGKRTTYLKDGSGRRASRLEYPDGCITVYEHTEDGRVRGVHFGPGTRESKFDRPEGQSVSKHPHHKEGPSAARANTRGVDAAAFIAEAWDRALRWNGLRR